MPPINLLRPFLWHDMINNIYPNKNLVFPLLINTSNCRFFRYTKKRHHVIRNLIAKLFSSVIGFEFIFAKLRAVIGCRG